MRISSSLISPRCSLKSVMPQFAPVMDNSEKDLSGGPKKDESFTL
jgi:hypothetical protein